MFKIGQKNIWWLKKIKNIVLWTYVISNVKVEQIVGTFCKKELQKTNLKVFRVEKVINKKGNKLYVKCKGYDSSFTSLIDKKDIVM